VIAGATLGIASYYAVDAIVHNEFSSDDGDGNGSFDTDNPENSNPLEGEPGSCSECNNKKGKKSKGAFMANMVFQIKMKIMIINMEKEKRNPPLRTSMIGIDLLMVVGLMIKIESQPENQNLMRSNINGKFIT
jgi:hypothetical protein